MCVVKQRNIAYILAVTVEYIASFPNAFQYYALYSDNQYHDSLSHHPFLSLPLVTCISPYYPSHVQQNRYQNVA